MLGNLPNRYAIAWQLLFTIGVSSMPHAQADSTSVGALSSIPSIQAESSSIASFSSAPTIKPELASIGTVNLPAASVAPNATIASTRPPTKAFQTSASSPTVDIGLGFFQLRDVSVGTKLNRGAHQCYLQFSSYEILGCKDPYAIIGQTYCVDLNGRRSASICGGVVTVDFPAQPSGPTYIHYTAANGTYTGCTAPSKSSGGSCINNQLGEGTFGSPGFVGNWCVMDITQYQKTDPSKPASSTAAQYSYDISVYDSDTTSTASDSKNGRSLIASTKSGSPFFGPDKSAVTVNFDGTASKLPGSITITSGNVDSDSYTLSYKSPYLQSASLSPSDAENWNSYDTSHQCSLANVFPDGGKGNVWGYDGGNRKNTCGFTC